MKVVLQNRNLQLYFSGQLVSLIGTWMQQMAVSWLIYRLTNSTFMLGLVAVAGQLPSLVLTPFAGIVADRADRKWLVIVTQISAMLQAAVLATVVLSGQHDLWKLLLLCAISGAVTAFDLPGRQTFLVEILDDSEQLPGAIGFNSSLNTITRLIGPFVAGICVTAAGEGMCFLLNAVSYIAVIAALFCIKTKPRQRARTGASPLEQMKEGFAYVAGFAPIRDLIVFLACLGLFATPFATLMPAFARDVFHGNATTLGCLSGAAAAGSVAGALFLTSRKGIEQLSRWIVAGCALCGVALLAFGFSTNFSLSLAVVALAGFSTMVVMAGSNTLIQTIVDEDKRGRVMSFVVMAMIGMAPFGGMGAGALANIIGSGKTVMITGSITLLLAAIFATRILRIHEKIRRIDLDLSIESADEELRVLKV